MRHGGPIETDMTETQSLPLTLIWLRGLGRNLHGYDCDAPIFFHRYAITIFWTSQSYMRKFWPSVSVMSLQTLVQTSQSNQPQWWISCLPKSIPYSDISQFITMKSS